MDFADMIKGLKSDKKRGEHPIFDKILGKDVIKALCDKSRADDPKRRELVAEFESSFGIRYREIYE
jgi:hypothetical protein